MNIRQMEFMCICLEDLELRPHQPLFTHIDKGLQKNKLIKQTIAVHLSFWIPDSAM